MSLADIEHLPKVVTDVDGIRDILLALDPEIVLLREDISQLIKELYIATTEKYIDRWEQDFSLPYDGSLTLEQRRQRVKNKLARKKVLNWQNLRLLIKNNVVKPRFYIVNEAENYHFKIFLEQQPQKQEFDLSKFTVVGSPTITEDGVASGFSTSNYLAVPFDITKSFELKYRFKHTSSANQNTATFLSLDEWQNVIVCNRSSHNLWLTTTNPNFTFTNAEYTCNIQGVKADTWYNGYLKWDGETYTFGVEGKTPQTISSIYPPKININKLLYLGRYRSLTEGKLDLKQFSITVDGKEVFSGIKNIDYITNELRTSLKQAKPAYLTFDLIVTEFFTRYCGTFSSGTEPL